VPDERPARRRRFQRPWGIRLCAASLRTECRVMTLIDLFASSSVSTPFPPAHKGMVGASSPACRMGPAAHRRDERMSPVTQPGRAAYSVALFKPPLPTAIPRLHLRSSAGSKALLVAGRTGSCL
jgi:hypothetical protein